jgi:hypothetical protein
MSMLVFTALRLAVTSLIVICPPALFGPSKTSGGFFVWYSQSWAWAADIVSYDFWVRYPIIREQKK